MTREETIAFLREHLIGDLERKVIAALDSSTDEELMDLTKAVAAEDPAAKAEIQKKLLAEKQAAAASAPQAKIDASKLKKPSSGGGEQVW